MTKAKKKIKSKKYFSVREVENGYVVTINAEDDDGWGGRNIESVFTSEQEVVDFIENYLGD